MYLKITSLLFVTFVAADPVLPSNLFTSITERISNLEKAVEDLTTVQRKHQEQIIALELALRESNENAKTGTLRDTGTEIPDSGYISTMASSTSSTTATNLNVGSLSLTSENGSTTTEKIQFTTTEEAQISTETSAISRFFEAVQRGSSYSVFQLRLKSGVPGDLRRRNRQGYQALHLAVIAGNEDVVRYLVGEGASITSRGHNLQTSLHCAVANGHTAIVRRLLHYVSVPDALVSTPDYFGKTPFDLAMDTGNVDIIRELVRHCSADTIGSYATRVAAEKNQEILTTLLTTGKRIKMPYLQIALNSAWDSDSMWTIIDAAEPANLRDVSLSEALHQASKDGRAAALSPLIFAGADVSFERDRKTALITAVENKRPGCVRELIALGANTSRTQQGISALKEAARVDCAECMQLIMESGFVGKNVVDELLRNGTLMDIALSSWSLQSAKILMGKGAVMTKKEIKSNYLLEAVTKCDVEILKLLIDSGADINIIIESLHISLLAAAVRHRNKDCVQLLLSSGADPNLSQTTTPYWPYYDTDFHSALHEAVINDDLDNAKILLEFGADVNPIGDNINSPKSLAKSKDMKNLLERFQSSSRG